MAAVAPIRELGIERDRGGRDLVPERLEQAPDERLAPARRNYWQVGLERDRRGRQLLVALARPGHGALEDVDQPDREERRGDVRPVVDVFRQREAADAPAAPPQAD